MRMIATEPCPEPQNAARSFIESQGTMVSNTTTSLLFHSSAEQYLHFSLATTEHERYAFLPSRFNYCIQAKEHPINSLWSRMNDMGLWCRWFGCSIQQYPSTCSISVAPGNLFHSRINSTATGQWVMPSSTSLGASLITRRRHNRTKASLVPRHS